MGRRSLSEAVSTWGKRSIPGRGNSLGQAPSSSEGLSRAMAFPALTFNPYSGH